MTLIEMLVVLTLFAIVAGAVVLALPNTQRANSSEAAARAWAARLDRAMDLALTTTTGFGIRHEGAEIAFVQRAGDQQWGAHSNAELASAKLSARGARISINKQEVFSVSATLVPENSTPLRAEFGRGSDAWVVIFDGARVRIQEGLLP